MSDHQRVPLPLLKTGVPGLDEVLGGGLPEYSLNLIGGPPGSGKTTLAHQIMFANATSERPAVYFTVLGEPPIKMLRYQQQLGFFDPNKIGSAIHFVSLGQVLLDRGLDGVLAEIIRQVNEMNPSIVVVDSFLTIIRALPRSTRNELDLQDFVERLSIHLTSWQATTLLIAEYPEAELQHNPLATITDGMFWLGQSVHDNSVVRKLQVLKLRGQAPKPGLHTFRISGDGLRVFPRIFSPEHVPERLPEGLRLSTGVPDLDVLMGGGIPVGNSVLITGPPGTGKSVLGAHFIAEGAQHDEVGVVVLFEQVQAKYLRWASNFGVDIHGMMQQGLVHVLPMQRVDLTPDEAVQAIWQLVERHGAKRVLIDSLTGFEVAVTTTEQDELRQAMYRLLEGLAALGVTVIAVMESIEESHNLLMATRLISFLSDNIVIQRYVEIAGTFERVLTVLKMRNSAHSTELRRYHISAQGLVIDEPLEAYEGVSTGVAVRRDADAGARPGAASGGTADASQEE